MAAGPSSRACRWAVGVSRGEMAGPAVFLASDASSYLTGQSWSWTAAS